MKIIEKFGDTFLVGVGGVVVGNNRLVYRSRFDVLSFSTVINNKRPGKSKW